jgi:teichuronic acid biosynthesis glycosyltransferase TuaC
MTVANVLSLSCVFPRPGASSFGTFVWRRLERLARRTVVKVVSPVGIVDYSHPAGKALGNSGLPAEWNEENLEVWYPRWLYPPGGGALNAKLLSFQLRRPLARLRRRFPFQLIDAHFGYPDGIAAARLARGFGVPYMITLRGNEPMHCENSSIRAAMSEALRGAARVITVSETLRQFAIGLGATPEIVKTIPNGIDSTIFHPRDRQACRGKHGLGLEERIVLSAGSLIERKGHHRVVEAVAAVRREGMPVRLVIAGGPGREGRFEQEIRAAVRRHQLENAVTFTGQLDAETLAEWMAAADVLVLASTREGWPNVVHEAMGCGTPAIATDVGAIPDMIPSAEYGIVVPRGDAPALNNALLTALRRVWDREKIAAWAQARDWDHVADEVFQEIQQIVR